MAIMTVKTSNGQHTLNADPKLGFVLGGMVNTASASVKENPKKETKDSTKINPRLQKIEYHSPFKEIENMKFNPNNFIFKK